MHLFHEWERNGFKMKHDEDLNPVRFFKCVKCEEETTCFRGWPSNHTWKSSIGIAIMGVVLFFIFAWWYTNP